MNVHSCQSKIVIGCDEAGKGPVLGPMVIAAVRAPQDALPATVGDSKAIPHDKRQSIATELRQIKCVTTTVEQVTTDRIDLSDTNLNVLVVQSQAQAVERLLSGSESVLIDASDVKTERVVTRFQQHIHRNIDSRNITALHRADQTEAIVGAASIMAKVHREDVMAKLAKKYEEWGPIGSGYPNDPQTRSFLTRYVRATDELPACARGSWSTAEDILTQVRQSTLSEF